MSATLPPVTAPDLPETKFGARAVLALRRMQDAREALRCCNLCAHRCGVDRLAGVSGLCGANSHANYFTAQLEVADELELVPTFAIALNGCDLRCKFCITGDMSWHSRAGHPLDTPALANAARQAMARGARSIMVLGGEPTIHVPALLELASALPDSARLVLKTNGHCTPDARVLLDGIFDDWVVDLKFGNDACAGELARIQNYLAAVHGNLLWAAVHSRLIIRHLLLPGHVECCWIPIARWIAGHLPGVKVSLRDSYWPAWHARRSSPLNRLVSPQESAQAKQIAADYELNLIL